MNPREKRMAITLGALLAFAAVAGGYMLVYSPYTAKRDQIAILKKTIEDKEKKKDRYYFLAKQAEGYKAMSLPADATIARRQYDRILSTLLTKAGAPPGFTVNPKPDSSRTTTPIMPAPEGTGVVTQGKEKYAYSKVVSEIKIAKVDLRILGEFLRAYHNLPLLQHISQLKITRKDEPGTTAARRNRDRTDPENWKDLEVLITTEALILDGAEDRKGLVPFPKNPTSAALGGAFYTGLKTTSDSAYHDAIALAYAATKPPAESTGVNSREYLALVGKDIFHGPIPKDPDPGPVYVPPPEVKENIDRFIKLNEITRRGDGSAKFELRDQASNFVYTGVLTPKGEKIEVEVGKNWFGPSGKAISDYKYKKELIITDDGKTASNYTFKIVAVDSVEGLVLAGSAAAKPEAPQRGGNGGGGGRGNFGGGGGRGNFGGGFGPPRLPAPKPNAALAGGWLATLPASDETFYYLKNGGSLLDMFKKPLKPAEVMDIVRRNSANGLNPYLNADVTLPTGEPVAELSGAKQ